jgi:hypothetical protein
MDATAIDKIFKGGETMALSKHGTEIPTEQRDLLATLVVLRGDVMAEGDKLLGRGRDLIQREVLWFNRNGHLDKGDKIMEGGVR